MASYCIVLILFLSVVVAKDPLVTLNHGGQLQGKTFDYDGLNIDLFLGKAEFVYNLWIKILKKFIRYSR